MSTVTVDDAARAEESKECSIAVSSAAGDSIISVSDNNAKSVAMDKTDNQCSTEAVDAVWNAEEDDKLLNAVEQCHTDVGMETKWDEVANLVSGRSANDCESRWLQCRSDVRSWTEGDDETLRQAVMRHGETEKAWKDAADLIERRNWINCRFRWREYLHPDLKKEPFSEEEDRLLVKSVREEEGRWKDVMMRLPGRSRYGTEDHWMVNVRPRLSDDWKTADRDEIGVKTDCLQIETTKDNESQGLNSDKMETECEDVPQVVSTVRNGDNQMIDTCAESDVSESDVSESDVSETKEECLNDNSSSLKAGNAAAFPVASVGSDAAPPIPSLKQREESVMSTTKTKPIETSKAVTSIDLCDFDNASSSKEEMANQPAKAPDDANTKSQKVPVEITTTSASNVPSAVTISGNSATRLHVTPVTSVLSSQIKGSKSSLSITSGAIAGLLVNIKPSGGEITSLNQPKIYQQRIQPVVPLTTSVVPTAAVYPSQGSVVSSVTKPSSSLNKPIVTSSVTSIRNLTVASQKSHGITAVHLEKLPGGQYKVVGHQGLVNAATAMSPTSLQRLQSLTTNSTSTASVIQSARISQVTVRPASVLTATPGKVGDLVRVRKPLISSSSRLPAYQPSEMKSRIETIPATKAVSAGRQVTVTLSVSSQQAVTTWPGSAFSAVPTVMKTIASSLPGKNSNGGSSAQNVKGSSTSLNQQQARTHVAKTDAQRRSSAHVPFRSHAAESPVAVLTQQTGSGSKTLQTRPSVHVMNKQPQTAQRQSIPAFTATKLESSGATSSVRAALNAATTQASRTTSTVMGSSPSITVKPAGSNLPPPPALIHTPKTSLAMVSKRDVASTSTRLSSGSGSVMSTSSSSSAEQRVLLYNVGDKKLGNLKQLSSTSESKKNEASQQKRRIIDTDGLQKDGGMRVTIMPDIAVPSKETEGRSSSRRSSTLTAEDIALMERFGDWEDSASSESDSNRGESQQSIRDDPDFRPSSIRTLKQRTSADEESDDAGNNQPPKRKKDDESIEIDDSRNGCDTINSPSVEGNSRPDKLGNPKKRFKPCKHCGSSNFFRRGEHFMYCTVCKRKVRQQGIKGISIIPESPTSDVACLSPVRGTSSHTHTVGRRGRGRGHSHVAMVSPVQQNSTISLSTPRLSSHPLYPKVQPLPPEIPRYSPTLAPYHVEPLSAERPFKHPELWSLQEVTDYFKSTDCAQYVHLFEDQQIDGYAMTQLSEKTLVDYLGIKLGPALKICRHVQMLQEIWMNPDDY